MNQNYLNEPKSKEYQNKYLIREDKNTVFDQNYPKTEISTEGIKILNFSYSTQSSPVID